MLMNSFNKLYNILLEDIISQNKATRKNMIQKAIQKAIMKPSVGTRWLLYFATLDNKTADFLCKFVADGTIVQRSDERIQKVKKILELNSSIDTQSYKGTLDQFIKQNSKMLDKHQQKVTAQSIQYLDSIPEFSQKKEYPNGVVIYKVADTKEAQKAVRHIVDIQWGKDSNPWCLITRAKGQKPWAYWQGYCAYPKHIAFQNGKLLAFCANDVPGEILWWDKQDNHSEELKVKGETIKTEKYDWSPEEKAEKLVNRESLWDIEETGKYDSTWGVTVGEEDLVNGHLPIKFGYVPGDFDCDAESLISLQGAPEKVDGNAIFRFKTLPPKEQLEAYKKKINKTNMKVHQRTRTKIWSVVYE